MDKIFKYIMDGGTESDKQAASMEYLEGTLGGVLDDLLKLDAEHKNLREAVKDLLDLIDRGEALQVALLKVRALL